ncbi:UBA-like_superfamily [Hexamita inflata]|uniref:UBA-like superfamily n=1 Tax=Hexamita inflata TaxID=28002 RepID=A0AA86U6Y0_9EUKA|nr:UBA-like superfamily [Hexamita inflata]
MNEYQKIQQFNDVTQCSVEQATRFLKQNNYNVDAAMDAFYESGEQAENAVPIEKPQPSEFAIKQMMDSTSTSREQAILYLQNSFNSVPEAINKFIDSGDEPRGQIDKQPEKPAKDIYNQNQNNYSENNNNQQNNYNNFDNVEDDNDYNTNQSQKSKSKQPVQKENKQVKSFFTGANNQVRFQETMNVSFDIATKYINAAGGDYDKAVNQYLEDQTIMNVQTQKNKTKSKQKTKQPQQNNDDNDSIFKPVSKSKKQRHQQNSNGYNQNAQYEQNQQFNYQAYPQQDQMQYDPNIGPNYHYNDYPYDNQYYQNMYGQNQQQPPQFVNQGQFYGQGRPPLQSDQPFGQQVGSVPPQPYFDQGQYQNPQMFNAPFQQQLQNGQYHQNDQQFSQVPVNFNQNNMQNGFQVQEHTPAPPPIPFNSQNQVQPNIQLTTTNFPQNGPNQFEQVQGINFGAQNNQGFNQQFNQPQVNFQQQNTFNSAQPNVSNTQQFTPTVQNSANQQFAVGQTESNQFVNQNNAHTGQFNANETKSLPFVSSAPFNQLNSQTVQQNPAKQLTPPVLNQQFLGQNQASQIVNNQAFAQGQNQPFQANGQFTQTFLNNPANQFTDNNQQQNLQGSQQATPPFIQSHSVSQQPFVNQFENNQAPTQFNGSNQVNFTSRTTNFPQIDQTQTSQPFSGVQSTFNAQNQQPTNLFAQNANPVVNQFGQKPTLQQAQPNQFEFKPEQTPALEFKPQTGVNFGQPAKPGQIAEIIKAKENQSASSNPQGNNQNQFIPNQFAQGNTINPTNFENPTQAPNSQPTPQANQFNPQGNGQQFNPNQFQGNNFGSAAQAQNFQPNQFNPNGNQGANFNAFESKQVPNNQSQFGQSPFDPTKQNQFAQFNQNSQNQGVNFGQNQNGFDPKFNGNTFNSQQFQQK